MRKVAGTVLVEHLGAIMVTTLLVAWIVGLHTYYHASIVPLRQAASARYAARMALASAGEANTTLIHVGPEVWEVSTSVKQITVRQQNGPARFVFAAGGNDAH